MMNKTEFFISLGMTEYEARTVTSLIRLKVATAKELSQDSGVPQNKLYAILKKFELSGMLAKIPDDKKKYKLINLKTLINDKIKERESLLKKLKKESKEIENPLNNEEGSVFSLIIGQKAIMNKLAEHSSKAKKEILGVQRNWKVWGEGLREMENATKRGVKAKLIGVLDDETKERAIEWKKSGCKIRSYNKKFGENPLRFTIIDNKEARITIGKPEISNPKDYITIWTKSKPLINILRNQFQNMWKDSKPIETYLKQSISSKSSNSSY